jgi:hypothetical protein
VDGSDRHADAHSAARLWIPRLAAYTGAKIVALAALRREDCLHDEDGWSIRLNDGGRADRRARRGHDAARRTIPLHRTLAAMGFPGFVEGRPPGLLFAADEDLDRTRREDNPPTDDRVHRLVRRVRPFLVPRPARSAEQPDRQVRGDPRSIERVRDEGGEGEPVLVALTSDRMPASVLRELGPLPGFEEVQFRGQLCDLVGRRSRLLSPPRPPVRGEDRYCRAAFHESRSA